MSDNNQPTYGAYRPGGEPEPARPGTPYTPGGAQVPPSFNQPPQQPARKLPGRGLPITLIVIGAIIAFIAAPVAGFIGMFTSAVNQINIVDIAEKSDLNHPTADPMTVEVSGPSGIVVMAQDGPDTTCRVTDASGSELQPQSTQTEEGVVVYSYSSTEDGTYTADCQAGDGSPALLHAGALSVTSIAKGALIPAFVAFGIGLAMLIGGIIWLVKRNRQRREIMANTGF